MADEPDDGLTEAERKFLETRGTSGLPEPTEEPPAPDAGTAEEQPASTAEAPAAEPETTAQPAAGAQPAPEEEEDEPVDAIDPTTGKKHPERVNYNRFRKLQERYDAQAQELNLTRSEMAQLKETVSRADERMKIINEALQAPSDGEEAAEAQDPAPDPREDIFGYVAWQGRQMERMQERLSEQVESLREHYGSRTATEDLVTNYRNDAARYAATNPQFASAYAHLINTRMTQLEAAGVDDLRQRQQIVVDEERALVEQSYASRINPAERIFNVAKAYGFNPNAAAVAPTTPPRPAAAVPPSPSAAAAPVARPNVGAEIDNIKAGQSASFSLSQAGGAPPDALTPEILANMNEEDFGRLMDKLTPAKLRALLPGA